MPAHRYLPSDSTLAKWREEGLTAPQIRERIMEREGVDVALGSVYSALSRAGLTDLVRYSDFIPWTPIRTDHTGHYALAMLRLAARRDAGEKLSTERSKKLDAWVERLRQENAVVAYVHDSPDGFYYCPARPGIDVGLIRIPD